MEHVKNSSPTSAPEGHKAVGVSGKRSDIDGHVTGRTQYYADRTFPGMLHLKMVRSPHHHARILSVDTSEAEKVPGRRPRAHPQGRAEERLHDPLPDPGRARRRAVPRRRQGPLQGRADRRGPRRSEAAAREAAAKVKVEYEELPAVFDVEEALKPGAPLVNEYHGQNFFKYEGHHCRRVRYGDVEKAFADGRPRPRGALPVLADRACADRDDRLHRRARRERPLHLLFQHAGAVLHARQHRADPQHAVPQTAAGRRHGRRRFWRQGRRDRRADRLPRRRCSPTGR